MSQFNPLPPSAPPSAESRSSERPSNGAGAWIAWAVIWLVVAVMLLLPNLRRDTPVGKAPATTVPATTAPAINPSADDRTTASTAPSTAPALDQNAFGTPAGAPAREPLNNPPLRIATKIMVGMKALSPQSSATATAQLEGSAKSLRDKIAVAIAAGFLQEPAEAQKRLAALSAGQTVSTADQSDIHALQAYYADPAVLDAAGQQRLIDQYGYFGKLALATGKPESDPIVVAIDAEGKRAATIIFAALGVGGVVLLLSVALFITAIVLYFTGKLPRRFIPPHTSSTALLEMFALYLLLFIGLSILVGKLGLSEHSLIKSWSLVTPPTLIAVLAYGLARGLSWKEMRSALGWRGGAGWYIELPLGVAGYIACLPVMMLGIGISLILIKLSGSARSHPLLFESLDTPRAMLEVFLLAAVGAPVVEETMFRGAFFAHLRRRWGWWVSAPLVALVFAAIHPQGWPLIPGLGSIALVLAALREWRGSTLASMAAHALNNGTVVMLLILLS